MATIQHSVLTSTEIHEPKGADSAALGEVYVADGSGSGNWSSIGTSSFTGMIADFTWPVVQSGWLELDGSVISTSTYAALFAVMSISETGTRVSGSAIVTSIGSTTNIRAGYYVFGTGFASGTTVVSVDSATQITLSANASSSGTSTLYVSPWLMDTGTIKLPDVSAAGRYRRSRTSTTRVGQLQDASTASHTHTYSGNTGTNSTDHSHTYSGTSSAMSANNVHSHTTGPYYVRFASASAADFNYLVPSDAGFGSTGAPNTSSVDINHTHTYSGTTSGASTNHTHAFSGTTAATGGTETAPITLIVMTCVKT